MAKFKKFTGNYIEVVKALGLPDVFYANLGKETYKRQIKLDLGRIKYLSYQHTVAQIQARLEDTSHLSKGEYSYSQGDFFAGFFSEISIKNHDRYNEVVTLASNEKTLENVFNAVDFSYTDDEGNLCGLSIAYLRDDCDPNNVSTNQIPVHERKLPFNVAVIKHVNREPAQREVTFISHISFLSRKLDAKGTSLAAEELPLQLSKVTNSKAVNQLLTGLFHDDSVELEPFLALTKRLRTNTNIDNRDVKLEKLFDLFVMQARLLPENSLNDKQRVLFIELTGIMQSAYGDINFFKDKSVEDIEQIVELYQQNPIIMTLRPIKSQQKVKDKLFEIVRNYNALTLAIRSQLDHELNQSIAARNRLSLLLLVITTLTVMSIALTLAGVFIPIGLTISAGLVTTLALTSIGLSGALALERAAHIINHELELNAYSNEKEINGEFSHHQLVTLDKNYDREIYEVLKDIEFDITPEFDTTPPDSPSEPITISNRKRSESAPSIGTTSSLGLLGRSRSLGDIRSVLVPEVLDPDDQTDSTLSNKC